MDYENQRMEYEDKDVKHERTISSAPDVRIFRTYCSLQFRNVCSSILLISSIKLVDSSIITAFSEMGLNFSSDAKS